MEAFRKDGMVSTPIVRSGNEAVERYSCWAMKKIADETEKMLRGNGLRLDAPIPPATNVLEPISQLYRQEPGQGPQIICSGAGWQEPSLSPGDKVTKKDLDGKRWQLAIYKFHPHSQIISEVEAMISQVGSNDLMWISLVSYAPSHAPFLIHE